MSTTDKRNNKTYLAIDYGKRRVGLAKSDPSGLIASALETIEVKSNREALDRLSGFIAEYQPAALIIGYPLNEDGSTNDACENIDRFIEKLKNIYDGPIHKVDEYGTSEEAASIIHVHGQQVGRKKKKKKRVDRLAAVIILQRFLDEQN
ncbi:MAG: Holliday junction resolvase RuvX [candidate division Zixibacteria bacterium]|nr:Holliday junction resolvase RuvX [candidate division Zixibacteria bacterium]